MRCAALLVLIIWAPACAAAAAACVDGETIVWSCANQESAHAVCASHDLSETSGYLQYRASENGESELTFPSSRIHPAGLFAFSLLPRGAMLSFESDGLLYEMWEGLEGMPSMTISKTGTNVSTMHCTVSDHSLTLTDTIHLLQAAGVADRALAAQDATRAGGDAEAETKAETEAEAEAEAADVAAITELLNDFLAGVDAAASHDRFWAEDLVYTSSDGKMMRKADIMQGFDGPAATEPAAPSPTYSAEDVLVRRYGDAAALTFRLVHKLEGEPDRHFRNSGMLVRRDLGWQVVTWSAVAVNPQGQAGAGE